MTNWIFTISNSDSMIMCKTFKTLEDASEAIDSFINETLDEHLSIALKQLQLKKNVNELYVKHLQWTVCLNRK